MAKRRQQNRGGKKKPTRTRGLRAREKETVEKKSKSTWWTPLCSRLVRDSVVLTINPAQLCIRARSCIDVAARKKKKSKNKKDAVRIERLCNVLEKREGREQNT